MALSISITTRMEREIVEAVLATALEKIEQPPEMSGNAVEQRWKWVCESC